jgi:hypothetical protein
MNITPKSLIDFKEFARDVRRSEAEGSAVLRTIPGNILRWNQGYFYRCRVSHPISVTNQPTPTIPPRRDG